MFSLAAAPSVGIVSVMSCSCLAICNPDTPQPVNQRPLELTPGDAPTLRFQVINPDASPFNLADYDVDFYIKRSMQDTDVAAQWHGSLGAGIEIANEEQDGLLDVTIPAATTAVLRALANYSWFLRLSHEIDLTKIYIPARGTFLLALPGT